MTGQLKLMCVFAHPDDESLGMGGTLARYAAEGIQTYLLTATRGEVGWPGARETYPGPRKLGEMREAELRKAADILGVHEVALLDYQDGELDQAEPACIISEIASHLRRVRPHVVVTFDSYGAYGHPDHIAICQFTSAAIVRAASPSQLSDDSETPHQVSKFYYRIDTTADIALYQETFGELIMNIDGVDRRVVGWPEWAVTTRVDTRAYWRPIWDAIFCHQTQLSGLQTLQTLTVERKQDFWQIESFYRVFSLVNGGRQEENDLFAGLRQPESLAALD